MFVISLSNMLVTTTGLADRSPIRKWDKLDEAILAAIELNAQHGLYAYVSPAERTDMTRVMIDTHSFGYAN